MGSSLRNLADSLQRGEILLPKIRTFLAEREAALQAGTRSHAYDVKQDARMTINTFRRRHAEYNHKQVEVPGEFFHPSQLGACMRLLWFSVKGAPVNGGQSSEDLMRRHLIFETGTYIHVMFQNLCDAAGVLDGREVPIIDAKLRIIGHADGRLLIDGHKYLLEIKTINARGFATLKDDPKFEHKQQTHAYMKSLGLDCAIIVYLGKDRHQSKEYVIPFSKKFYADHVANRIDKYFTHLRKNTMPEREGIAPGTFPCSFCEFSHVCFKESKLKVFLKKIGAK